VDEEEKFSDDDCARYVAAFDKVLTDGEVGALALLFGIKLGGGLVEAAA
jgi:hypothetical protein